MKIVCVVPPLNFPVNEIGHGYQPPLGLLTVAGPLVDAGFSVELLDADAGHLSHHDIIDRLRHLGAQAVLIGHSGSIVANPTALNLMADIKAAFPNVVTVYGGVYPTYAYREIMRLEPAVDFIVCGEGEVTTLALLTALQDGKRDLSAVEGLAWRSEGEIVINQPRRPIQELDQFRVAWELADWSLYQNHHLPGRSAIVQFSRGCPHTCTYCGQWMFWKHWRHRSVERFADELQYLHERYDVGTVWIADENWGHDRELLGALLEAIVARKISTNIFCAMCAEDIVRDVGRLELYRQAGVICLMMGMESFDEAVLVRIGKNNSYTTTSQAVSLLREHGILSVVNVIYGLRRETWSTLWQTFRQLRAISPDFYNALHLTPLSWTLEGREVDLARIIQLDQRKWDFRQPVIRPDRFSPKTLAVAVKLSEALFYLRPLWLLRRLFDQDAIKRLIMRDAFPRLVRVYLGEWSELLQTTFARPGQVLEEIDQIQLLMPRITISRSTVSTRRGLRHGSHSETNAT